ncbi:hypothetical protein BB561_002692 [Smittium simulii]|uniref:Uncharacterized protein n=1 Tax=Smittium simulii TaxID=133385 RepID=A0A2T9YPL3_9FUNG|nr:hypothetical protein BB561_002692 [Smittium simulii]
MSTRLDRLVATLENGTTPGVRMAAAQQLGAIQEQHPAELFNLLERIYKSLISSNWDSRIAASQAIEAIAKKVFWDLSDTPTENQAHNSPIIGTGQIKDEPNSTIPLDSKNSPIKIEKNDENLSTIDPLNDYKVYPNPPLLNTEVSKNSTASENLWLIFAQFNMENVLSNGRLLLASAGDEFDYNDLNSSSDSTDMLQKQKKMMKEKLGLTLQLVEGDFIDAEDFDIPKPQINSHIDKKPKSNYNIDKPTPPADLSNLSARERNALKRKNKKESKHASGSNKFSMGSKEPTAITNDTSDSSTLEVNITDQPGHSNKIVIESVKQKALQFSSSDTNSTDWPFEAFVDQLCLDLFESRWETRHGACLALRELLKRQGSVAGMRKNSRPSENDERHQKYLINIAVRLLYVLTLDRFADFVSDQVVAPVRETCAQVLGVISKYLSIDNVTNIEKNLLLIISRGANKNLPIWEIRHSGLLGLKYVIAVRNDISPTVFESIIDTILDGLKGSDDDVRSVSASSLLSLVSAVSPKLEHRFSDISNALWIALKEIDDDLASSTAGVMDLLSEFCKTSLSQNFKFAENKNDFSNNMSFGPLILLIFPFFRHTIQSVRLSSVQAVYTISHLHAFTKNDELPHWINQSTMLFLFQNLILETSPKILLHTLKLWNLICEKFFNCDIKFNTIFSDNILSIMFSIVTTQIGVPFDIRSFVSLSSSQDISNPYINKNVIDTPMLTQDLSLIPFNAILRCRIISAQALAKLLSVWELNCNEPNSQFYRTFINIVSKCLDSRFSLSIQVGSIIIEEWSLLCSAGIVINNNTQNTDLQDISIENLGLPPQPLYSVFKESVEKFASKSFSNENDTSSFETALIMIHTILKSLNQSICYRDLNFQLKTIHQDSKDLLLLFNHLINVPLSLIPQLPGINSSSTQNNVNVHYFDLDLAKKVINQVFPSLVSNHISNSIDHANSLKTIALKKDQITNQIDLYQKKHDNLDLTVSSFVANAATSFGILPSKLNFLIKPVMNSIKSEKNKLLQKRSAISAARLISECFNPPTFDANLLPKSGMFSLSPKTGPGDKIISNLISFLCSDPWTTPVLLKYVNLRDGIFMTEVVKFLQTRAPLEVNDEILPKTKDGHDVAMAAALNNSDDIKLKGDNQTSKKRTRRNTSSNNKSKSASQAKNINDSKNGLSDNNKTHTGANSDSLDTLNNTIIPIGSKISPKSLTEEEENDLTIQNIHRGALFTFEILIKAMGPNIFINIPKIWAFIANPLEKIYGKIPNWDSNNITSKIISENDIITSKLAISAFSPICDNEINLTDSLMLENSCTDGQAVVDSLSILETLSPNFDTYLKKYIFIYVIYWIVSCLKSHLAIVRHSAAKALSIACKVLIKESMLIFVQIILPWFGDSNRLWLRQAVAEAIYYLTNRLDEVTILPYIPFLIVPLLGRMSDPDRYTRVVGTRCFAQLLQLVPIGIQSHCDSNNLDIAADLKEQHSRDFNFLVQLTDSSRLQPFEIPIKINATLRKYQQDGINWLAFLNKYRLHGILCDDMGLGKTLQTICMIASDHYIRAKQFAESNGRLLESAHLPSLVVCPPTLMSHWEEEILKYVSVLKPLLYEGAPSERRMLLSKIQNYDVIIVSYDVLRNDIDGFSKINYNYCVLDEGHIIKNSKAKLTLAVKKVNARNRLILSGTPVQNNVLELWSLFDFLMPGFLGLEKQFNEQYSKPILSARDPRLPPQVQAQAQSVSQKALNLLHKQVLPFLLRRMKEEVLADLPPKIIQDRYCNLSDVQLALMDHLNKSVNNKTSDSETPSDLKNDKPKPDLHVFQALQYLRRLCNHPALVLNQSHPLYNSITKKLASEGKDIYDLSVAPKLQTLSEILLECGIGSNSAENLGAHGANETSDYDMMSSLDFTANISASHRALIFCQHREMLDCIIRDLFKRSMPSVSYLRLDGTIDARHRQSIVSKFNSDPSIDVLLLTTHVGGLGLNLTGADTVIFVEHDWNPMMDLQAMDRAHRLGQTKVVNVYRLITKNTLEEKVMGLQAFKLNIANSIVNQQNSGIQTMNTDEILDLFNFSSIPPASHQNTIANKENKQVSANKAVEGLEELWDSKQYETEYNMDSFISSLK